MSIYADVQSLEPGALVDLYHIQFQTVTNLQFHGYTQVGEILFNGTLYYPWPLMAEGIEANPNKPARPKLTVGNVDGSITQACQMNQDMVGGRVTRIRTLGKYLDGQPDADPTQHLPPEVWFIERKAQETKEVVVFELASAMEFGDQRLPRRRIVANVCQWKYRSAECGYTGPPVARADDSPTSDPNEDVCGKRLSSCKLRFGDKAELPFGSFPAAHLTRR